MAKKGAEQIILKLHVRVLKYLLIWPLDRLSKRHNVFLRYTIFCLGLYCSIPVYSAVVYQFYVGIDDVKVLLEALVGTGDIIGYTIAYICFLKNYNEIEQLLIDFQKFVVFSGMDVIQEAEDLSEKHTRYLLTYVNCAVVFNYIWQMMSTESCIAQRGSEFYIKHDPCWMPVRNLYPFDASQPKYFWVVYIIEVIYSYHICCLFSLATYTIIGKKSVQNLRFLMHITAQLKCCASKFEQVFDNTTAEEKSHTKLVEDFIHLIKYHQYIMVYSQRVFKTFRLMIVVYITLTSLLVAVIGYQIVNPKTSAQDRIKYFTLLVAWCFLVYMICYNGQQVQDEAVKVGQSIFKSHWYQHGVAIKLKPYLKFTLARTQKPLEFKAQFLGTISLFQFMSVMKWAYSGLTLLLAVTDDE